ncbi:MAG TPA: ABC transporter ATP-binding protein [Gammaproteobacteria bacterium]|mgnify:FL=1|nr:ABC transporter ATP-binding protein [Gammaproteobacteria bacterium]HBK11708.1 ABC transporter ATP-binding protein [Gammaproteobacteria bacterium]
MNQVVKKVPAVKRDYAIFEADISGAVLNMQLLRRLLRWLAPYKLQLLLSTVLVLLASTLQILLPIIISLVVIDHVLRDESSTDTPDFGMIEFNQSLAGTLDIPPLLAACILYGVLQIGSAVFGHAHRMTLIQAVINGLRDLRLDLFSHLETRPSSFFDRVAVGRIMTRVTNDVEALYELLRGLGTLIGEFVPFFVALAVMLAIDVQLTLLLLLALPVLALVTYYFRRTTRLLFRQVRQTLSALNQNLQENLAGLQVVQISDRQDYNLERYTGVNHDNRKYELGLARIETLYGAFNETIAHICIGLILYYGASQVMQINMTVGEVVLFTQFVGMLFHPIVVLGEQTNILFRAMASGERIFQALDWDEATHEPEHPVTLPQRLTGTVRFNNVDFAYDTNVPVLKSVSFEIAAGEKLAIVGPTGSGKSTLIRLLGRFYDFDDGQIFLDGFDLNHIHSHDLRKRVGVVLQDFHIFSGSIADNIALGNPNISRQRVIEAARTVNAHDFITALPQGYDTPLTERGQNLSQGQRQLLAFARVLAADPEILVLDEATANIDTETELLIQEALQRLTAGRTSIIIAHRLQTIQEADRVMVLDQGEVVEIGSHEELLAAEGLYATLHSLQFQDADPTVVAE